MEATGADLAEPFREALVARGETIDDRKRYRFATDEWVADHPEDMGFGGGDSVAPGPLLRDALIEHVQRHGFDQAQSSTNNLPALC